MVTFGFGVVDARSIFSQTGQSVDSVESMDGEDKLADVEKLVSKLAGVDKLVYKLAGVELNNAVAKLSSKLDATEDVNG